MILYNDTIFLNINRYRDEKKIKEEKNLFKLYIN